MHWGLSGSVGRWWNREWASCLHSNSLAVVGFRAGIYIPISNPIKRIKVSFVQLYKTTDTFTLCVSLYCNVTSVYVQFIRHKTRFVTVRKTLWVGLKYLIRSPHTRLDMSHDRLQNFHFWCNRGGLTSCQTADSLVIWIKCILKAR